MLNRWLKKSETIAGLEADIRSERHKRAIIADHVNGLQKEIEQLQLKLEMLYQYLELDFKYRVQIPGAFEITPKNKVEEGK